MTWANPEWFWALLILPLIAGLDVYRFFKQKNPVLFFSNAASIEKLPVTWRTFGRWLIPIVQLVAIALLIVALARPQLQNTVVERNAEGIDIMLVLDLSTSMRAEDLKPNRFDAAKRVAIQFIDKRTSDRIGLVAFAAQSFTVCPPSLDYDLLKKLLQDVKMGVIDDGTAIGMGLATAVNRLKESDAKSRVIILLTDGQNNSGEIDPVTAADLAQSYGIKVYTIGAGTRGTAPYPIDDPIFGRRYQNVKVDIDEEMLTKIAEVTGGKYYRAVNTESLAEVYNQIDALERTKVDELIYTDYEDLYERYLLGALFLWIAAYVLSKTVLKTELV
ncbi:VWA domain-containing protein [bacterium]|nr:MAG: VWA domain-containing protein [bacterium]